MAARKNGTPPQGRSGERGNGKPHGADDGAQRPGRTPRRPGGALRPIRTATGVSGRWGRKTWAWLSLAAVYLATVLLVGTSFIPVRDTREFTRMANTVAARDYEAEVTFSTPDLARLEEEIRRADREARRFYRWDSRAPEKSRAAARDLIEQAGRLAAEEDLDPEARAQRLLEWSDAREEVSIDEELAREVVQVQDFESLKAALPPVFAEAYAARAIVEDIETYQDVYENERIAVEGVPRGYAIEPAEVLVPEGVVSFLDENFEFRRVDLDAEQGRLLSRIAAAAIQPNLKYWPERTERERQDAIESLREDPPAQTFHKGEILVRKGRLVTPEDQRLLMEMNKVYRDSLLRRLFAVAIYIAILFGLGLYYFAQFRADFAFNARNVLMVSLIVLLPILLGRVFLSISKEPEVAAYAFPAAFIGMMGVILVDNRSAILLVTIGCLVFSVATGLDFKVFLTLFLGGYAAVASLTTVQARGEVLKAGLIVGVVNADILLLVNFIEDPEVLRFDLMFWGLGNGLLCAVLTMPALVLFEKFFDVVTDIRLLELTGLDHPLLQELEEKAPGSYQHSLNVTKLSEAAAKAIGANYLLVRAGAYYHDVGKTLKPKYFKENQVSIDEKNLHTKISPYMSAMVIKNHVKAGIDLAQKHGLPARVVDFIPQHQGTTIITYFFYQALKRFENSQSTDPVRESDFRYPGPKPQSIEAAVVMLADSVEATVTSRFTSHTVNEDELRLCVRQSINDKFADGQFDECDLTFRHLHIIRESFVSTLLSRFHERVDYPTRPERTAEAAASLAAQPAAERA